MGLALREWKVPKNKLEPIQEFLELGLTDITGIFLAGGALQTITNPEEAIYDYDLFFSDELSKNIAVGKLLSYGFERTSIFNNKTTMETWVKESLKIQVIYARYYKNPLELIDSFDFTCTMYAFNSGFLYYTDEAISATVRKEIEFHQVKFPHHTFRRIKKYKELKGYHITMKLEEDLIDMCYLDDKGNSLFYEGEGHDSLAGDEVSPD